MDNPVKRKHFEHLEADLAGLDALAWAHLKAQVPPLFRTRDEVRGWQAGFDKLNEAKAYNYLSGLACTDLAFIPVSCASGRKTPDLRGKLGPKIILCEVKTINPSDLEATARNAVAGGKIVARSTQGSLSDAFFRKLTSTLATAERQMRSYCPDGTARQIVYVVINFDDLLNQYVEDYLGQIQAYAKTDNRPDVEIVFDVKPAYYAATNASIS